MLVTLRKSDTMDELPEVIDDGTMDGRVFHYLNPTAIDEKLKNTRWRNRHTGVIAQVVEVHRIRGADNPIAELKYEDYPEPKGTVRWDNSHMLSHWTPVLDEEE